MQGLSSIPKLLWDFRPSWSLQSSISTNIHHVTTISSWRWHLEKLLGGIRLAQSQPWWGQGWF